MTAVKITFRNTKAHSLFIDEIESLLHLVEDFKIEQEQNLQTLCSQLHKFKGSAALFGYRELEKAIKGSDLELESSLKNLDAIAFDKTKTRLENAIKEVLKGQA